VDQLLSGLRSNTAGSGSDMSLGSLLRRWNGPQTNAPQGGFNIISTNPIRYHDPGSYSEENIFKRPSSRSSDIRLRTNGYNPYATNTSSTSSTKTFPSYHEPVYVIPPPVSPFRPTWANRLRPGRKTGGYKCMIL